MLRRVLIVAVGVFVVGVVVLVAGLVYVVLRPEEGGVKAARLLTERVETPAAMRLARAGTDQRTPYRDFLVADADLDELGAVRPPRGYRLDERFRDGGRPFPFGDWMIVAEWGGPDPRGDDRKDCLILLERTSDVRRISSALSASEKAAVEGRDRTLVRLSSVCEID